MMISRALYINKGLLYIANLLSDWKVRCFFDDRRKYLFDNKLEHVHLSDSNVIAN